MRKEGSEREPGNPAAWKGAETGRIWLLDTPINHPRGGGFPPGPGPLAGSGLDLIRQAPGGRCGAGRVGAECWEGSQPHPPGPASSPRLQPGSCLVCDDKMISGLAGMDSSKHSLCGSWWHWGSEAPTAPIHTALQEEHPRSAVSSEGHQGQSLSLDPSLPRTRDSLNALLPLKQLRC